MRTSAQLVFAAAVTLSAAAGAAPSSTVEATPQAMTVQTIVAAPYRPVTADAATLAGTYGLSNGEVLRVSYERNRLFAELGERKSELVPSGANSFTARGSALRLTFDQVPFATDVLVSGR